jgi:DNA primase, catalytic core
MIDNAIIDKILTAANIVDVIADFVKLTKRGINHWGICPFHEDRSPSLCISAAKQIYSCFSCGASGNVITFLQNHENMSYPEAIRYLGKKYNIEVPDKEISPEELQAIKKKEAVTIALSAATEIFTKNIQSSDIAKDYLSGRGWNAGVDPVLELFSVGYAENEYHSLSGTMLKQAYKEDTLLSADLIKKNERGYYDSFRGRIMFPFFDMKGNVVGFTGRSIIPDVKTAKYVNTGETSVYHKGSAIFGLYQARQAISQADKAYLVEGQFDVISMARAGIRHTVCGSGTALTAEQIRLLLRFTKNVTLIYDCDEAGVKASIKNIKSLIASGANVRAITLPEGEDPDSIVRTMSYEELGVYLQNRELDIVTYLSEIFKPTYHDEIKKNEALKLIAECVSYVQDKFLKVSYIAKISELLGFDIDTVKSCIRGFAVNIPKQDNIQNGFYGIDQLKETLSDSDYNCLLTDSFSQFRELYGEEPVIYFSGVPTLDQIQELRRHATFFEYEFQKTPEDFNERRESDILIVLKTLFKSGLSIYIDYDDRSYDFVDFYLTLYSESFKDEGILGSVRETYYERCAEVISCTSETLRVAQEKTWKSFLKIDNKRYSALLKPYLDKQKSKYAMQQQRSFDDTLLNDDFESVPDYVEENPEFNQTYKRHNFYPLLNKDKEPVGYMFKNQSGNGHTLVADFHMTPLLHIYDADPEFNKRVIKINRRYYKKPLYIEIKSKTLASMQSFEEILLNEEALNFENGEVKHFKKIRQDMSYKYVTCEEIQVYGQQEEDFFAFSNAIFHNVDDNYTIEMVSNIGVTTHKGKNYYLPAFSEIYAGLRKDNDKFEHLRSFVYKDIPAEKRCSFERWAALMNQVYHINDNGKWAVIYAIMCAFRSDIHNLDRLFTSLFLVGPTMSGKTQLAVSIRALWITPEMPCFNLNTGSDAAFSTLMGVFRDVPVVLEEFRSDISDTKFQALKSITYDGDGKQKRKGTNTKEIVVDKVYSPVLLLGQETPQLDDNALMNRVILCEVPKAAFTEEEKESFNTLKAAEKEGLCNILLEILKLRPLIRKHFRTLQREIQKELSRRVMLGSNNSGDMVRLINTMSLFLTTCKLVEVHAPEMKLPFSYDEFFELACEKVLSQVELISRTDKLAGFFKAMEIMINTKAIVEGREYIIDTPSRLKIKDGSKDNKEIILTPADTKVLYLRVSTIHALFERSSLHTEGATESTIKANLRSNPAYIGEIANKHFSWKEIIETPVGTIINETAMNKRVERTEVTRVQKTSCFAMNYTIFRQYFDIDLERSLDTRPTPEENKPDFPF